MAYFYDEDVGSGDGDDGASIPDAGSGADVQAAQATSSAAALVGAPAGSSGPSAATPLSFVRALNQVAANDAPSAPFAQALSLQNPTPLDLLQQYAANAYGNTQDSGSGLRAVQKDENEHAWGFDDGDLGGDSGDSGGGGDSGGSGFGSSSGSGTTVAGSGEVNSQNGGAQNGGTQNANPAAVSCTANDPYGNGLDRVIFLGSPDHVAAQQDAWDNLSWSERGAALENIALNSGKPLVVTDQETDNEPGYWNATANIIDLNPDHHTEVPVETDDGGCVSQPTPAEVILGHELGHVAGARDDGPDMMNNVNQNENVIRGQLGFPLRCRYNN